MPIFPQAHKHLTILCFTLGLYADVMAKTYRYA